MPRLSDKESGAFIGVVSDDQLRFLADALEEESDIDQDYWIDGATLDMLRDRGGDEALLSMLAVAFGEREGLTIEWE